MIAPGSRVLDIGCGDGTLIDHLFRTKGCDARGIEIDMAEVTRAVAHGLPVMHGDADTDLAHYPDGRSTTSCCRARCRRWSGRARCCGRCCASARARWSASRISAIGGCAGSCVRTGRMPMTPTWDRPWHETPNIHPCTIRDFFALCAAGGLRGGALARGG